MPHWIHGLLHSLLKRIPILLIGGLSSPAQKERYEYILGWYTPDYWLVEPDQPLQNLQAVACRELITGMRDAASKTRIRWSRAPLFSIKPALRNFSKMFTSSSLWHFWELMHYLHTCSCFASFLTQIEMKRNCARGFNQIILYRTVLYYLWSQGKRWLKPQVKS